ncbi:hypothetical protein ACFWOL_32940 [Streptomyces sp. NPDC058442]
MGSDQYKRPDAFKGTLRALKRVTLSPSRISDIARADLVLDDHWK